MSFYENINNLSTKIEELNSMDDIDNITEKYNELSNQVQAYKIKLAEFKSKLDSQDLNYTIIEKPFEECLNKLNNLKNLSENENDLDKLFEIYDEAKQYIFHCNNYLTTKKLQLIKLQ